MVIKYKTGGEKSNSIILNDLRSLNENGEDSFCMLASEIQGLEAGTWSYDVERRSCTVCVSGYRFKGNADGGNLASAGIATGAAFWPVSTMLADYLTHDCPILRGDSCDHLKSRNIIELGCGLGLAGIVAATLLGETDRVVLTDGNSKVTDMARNSIDRHSASHPRADNASLTAEVLQWDNAGGIENINIKCASLEHARVVGSGSFDLVIASDVIYDPNVCNEAAASLAKAANALLRNEDDEDLPVVGATSLQAQHAWIDSSGENAKRPPTRPLCVVAFQKRSCGLHVLVDAFAKEGFEMMHPLPGNVESEGYFDSIFGDRGEVATMFWKSCICCFTRARGK